MKTEDLKKLERGSGADPVQIECQVTKSADAKSDAGAKSVASADADVDQVQTVGKNADAD